MGWRRLFAAAFFFAASFAWGGNPHDWTPLCLGWRGDASRYQIAPTPFCGKDVGGVLGKGGRALGDDTDE